MSAVATSDKALRRVIGRISNDPWGDLLGTGFKSFESPTGIDGLFKIVGDRLEVLAVVARQAGRGSFRKFIATAKEWFREIWILEDINPLVGEVLARYGFERFEFDNEFGEHIRGWRWDTQEQVRSVQVTGQVGRNKESVA